MCLSSGGYCGIPLFTSGVLQGSSPASSHCLFYWKHFWKLSSIMGTSFWIPTCYEDRKTNRRTGHTQRQITPVWPMPYGPYKSLAPDYHLISQIPLPFFHFSPISSIYLFSTYDPHIHKTMPDYWFALMGSKEARLWSLKCSWSSHLSDHIPKSSNNLNLNFLIILNRFWHFLPFTGTLHWHVNHPGGVRLVHTRTFVIFRFRTNRLVSILALEENEINRLIPS